MTEIQRCWVGTEKLHVRSFFNLISRSWCWRSTPVLPAGVPSCLMRTSVVHKQEGFMIYIVWYPAWNAMQPTVSTSNVDLKQSVLCVGVQKGTLKGKRGFSYLSGQFVVKKVYFYRTVHWTLKQATESWGKLSKFGSFQSLIELLTDSKPIVTNR